MSSLLNAHQAMGEADFLTLAMILKADPVSLTRRRQVVVETAKPALTSANGSPLRRCTGTGVERSRS